MAKTATKRKPGTAPSADRDINNLATLPQEINPASVADLRPAGYNPRTITADQQKMLKGSLEEFGDIGVIIFNRRTGRLVGGHQRTKLLDPSWPIIKTPHEDGKGTVAKGHIETPFGHLNYREVDWSEQKEKQANIAANKHGGSFDEELLEQLLRELQESGTDMSLTGFSQEEIDELLGVKKSEELGQEDPEVEPVEDPFVKLGDLWVCGESRILCGDSTSIGDIDRLMMGEKADLCVTDPPYGVAYKTKAGKIENDDLDPAALEQFLKGAFSVMEHALKPGGAFYIYHADGGLLGTAFRNALTATKRLQMKQVLIWVKTSATLCRSDYNMQHEPLLYGWKEGAAHYYDGDFTRTSVVDDDLDLKGLDKKQLIALITQIKGAQPTTVIRVEKPAKSEIHPTMKPVRLFERNIYASSKPGEIVLDLFNGSGTTTITCRKTGRRGRGIELSPHYLQASLQRYQDYCGEEPMLMAADGSLTPFSEVAKARRK